jgi:hypothetical protein
MLLLVLIVGARLKADELFLFAAPSALLVMLYALTSPYFPRYGEPAHRIAILSVLSAIPALYGLVAGRRAPVPAVSPNSESCASSAT